MSILSDINKGLFGGNESKSLDTLNDQQKGVMNDIMNSAGTYRDLAKSSQSMYNPAWEQMQAQQVLAPMKQRMADNVRDLQRVNRKSGRATSAIGRRLQQSANLRMAEMNMNQGIIENQRRVTMENEARRRSLGYENMANQQLATVLGRNSKENIVQPKAGLLQPVLQLASAGMATKNLADQFGSMGSNSGNANTPTGNVSSSGVDSAISNVF